MNRILAVLLLILSFSFTASNALAQEEPMRDATREKLRQLLDSIGQRSDVNTSFRLASKQPYNFVGTMQDGMNFKNVDNLEIVISVTKNETIYFRVYPHYKGGYINIDKAKDQLGFAKKLLSLSDTKFLFWAVDDAGDAYAGYTFTLESGFPSEAITVVLRSIRNTDGLVGDLKPFFDGSSPPPATTHKGL